MKDIYEILKAHGVRYETYEHAAVYTVAEADIVCKDIPGKQVKNLFLTWVSPPAPSLRSAWYTTPHGKLPFSWTSENSSSLLGMKWG